ncbi:MAG TPA: response regulator [Aeromonadales bacterium]|nr:response regulator [Aeromonadales bacterium]
MDNHYSTTGISTFTLRHLISFTFLVLLLLGNTFPLLANNDAMQWLHFPPVKAKEGRQPDNISAVVQDKNGLIWIATLNGLYRYDGNEFRAFRHDPRDPSSLPNNLLTSMLLVDGSRLLLGSLQGGIFWFDTERQTSYPVKNLKRDTNLQVQTLFLENDQTLWVGSYSGLSKINLETGKIQNFIHNPLDPFTIPGRLVTGIIRDKTGQLWIGTDSGLARYNQKLDEFIQIDLPGLNNTKVAITSFFLDTDGSLWLGTNQYGLFHFTAAGSKISSFHLHEGNTSIRDILRISSGELWIATDKGIFALPAYGGKMLHYSYTPGDPLSLPDNDIYTLFEDDGNIIFIGSNKGLYKSAPQLANFGRIMHTPLVDDSLSHNFVTDLTELPNGNILISTLNGLDIFQYQNNNINHLNIVSTINVVNKKFQSVFVDSKNRTWLGTINGKIYVLDNQYRLIKTFSLSKNSANYDNNILFIKAQKNGTIWIGSEQQAVSINPVSLKIIQQFMIGGNHPLERAPLIDLAEDSHQNLWFATQGAGIIRFTLSDSQYRFFEHHADNLDSLSQNMINSIYINTRDDVWIATTNGLNKINYAETLKDKPKFTKWLESDGLNDADIRSLIMDGTGWLWLATGSGLSRLNLESNTFENFTEDDGLPSSVFTENASIMTKTGLLYFGSSNGISVVNPEIFKKNLHNPKILIEAISIKQGPWIPISNSRHQFNYDVNNIRFKIAVLDFYQPQYNQIQYQLHGYDSTLYHSFTDTIINFTNLDSGEFKLEVSATNNDGVSSKHPVFFDFSIATPFWFSWWAITIYLFIPFFILFYIFKNHNKKLLQERQIAEHLRKNDRLKDEFLAVISHELRTPLTGIIGITESLIEGSGGNQNKRTLEGLNLIVNSGHRLSGLVNEILDFKKLTHQSLQIYCRPIDLNSVLNVVMAGCQSLISNKPLTLNLDADDTLPAVNADSHRLQQILYNLLGNAIKFTEKGQITLSATLRQNKIRLAITDTGIGISQDQLSLIFDPFKQLEPSATRQFGGSGLGLAITKQLVELHHSSLKVESTPGKGSCFYFDLDISYESLTETSITTFTLEPVQLPSTTTSPETLEHTTETILVADDEHINRKVICDFLHLAGYKTIQANNGKEALHLAQTEDIDMIILDVMMPRLSGYEVCKQLRHHYSAIQLPILLISARRETRDIVAGLESGANDYISKPIDKNVLLARTKTLLLLKDISIKQKNIDRQKALTKVVNNLSRYFPKALVERLINHNDTSHFEASRKLITILFADLVGFTELTDRFEAEVITDLLNQFITEMNKLVEQHHGLLNEVLGDGLVVLFGSPGKMSKRDQAVEAVNLALDMQYKLKELGDRWLNQGLDHNVMLRIGIHQDFATVGNIGAENLLAYRAIGSGVNLSSRLQSECHPGKILLSYPVFAQTKDMFVFDELTEMRFKGFLHSHRVCFLDPCKNIK